MFYGNPEEIHLKIDRNRYTLLHDFFGDRYTFKSHIDDRWDEVIVKCVPSAMVSWAMQSHVFFQDKKISYRYNLIIKYMKEKAYIRKIKEIAERTVDTVKNFTNAPIDKLGFLVPVIMAIASVVTALVGYILYIITFQVCFERINGSG